MCMCKFPFTRVCSLAVSSFRLQDYSHFLQLNYVVRIERTNRIDCSMPNPTFTILIYVPCMLDVNDT